MIWHKVRPWLLGSALCAIVITGAVLRGHQPQMRSVQKAFDPYPLWAPLVLDGPHSARPTAPACTFTDVGSTAFIRYTDPELSAKGIVAGLQTFYVTQLTGDLTEATNPRLVICKDFNMTFPVLVIPLQCRVYDNEMLFIFIPESTGCGTANMMCLITELDMPILCAYFN